MVHCKAAAVSRDKQVHKKSGYPSLRSDKWNAQTVTIRTAGSHKYSIMPEMLPEITQGSKLD